MGLALVELHLAVEEAFGTEISDEEAARITTVDELRGVLRNKLVDHSAGPCACLRVFHLLRRELAPPRKLMGKLRLSTTLVSIMSLEEWRAQWKPLGLAMGLRMPPMQVPTWYARSMTASVASGSAVAWWSFGPAVGIAAAIGAGTLAAIGGSKVRAPRAPTVGALVRAIVANNHGELLRRGVAWSDAEALIRAWRRTTAGGTTANHEIDLHRPPPLSAPPSSR